MDIIFLRGLNIVKELKLILDKLYILISACVVFSEVTNNKYESRETFKQLISLMSCSKKINNCSFLCESLLSLIFDKSLKDKCLPHG